LTILDILLLRKTEANDDKNEHCLDAKSKQNTYFRGVAMRAKTQIVDINSCPETIRRITKECNKTKIVKSTSRFYKKTHNISQIRDE